MLKSSSRRYNIYKNLDVYKTNNYYYRFNKFVKNILEINFLVMK